MLMYAVVEMAGKQFKIKEGTPVVVPGWWEKDELAKDVKVLFFKDDNGEVYVGDPYLPSVKIDFEILKKFRGKKINVLKFRPKSNYRRRKNIKPRYTLVKITKLGVA